MYDIRFLVSKADWLMLFAKKGIGGQGWLIDDSTQRKKGISDS